MGQAKLRGTFEERKAQAIAKKKKLVHSKIIAAVEYQRAYSKKIWKYLLS